MTAQMENKDVRAYLAKTLDNMDGYDRDWVADSVRDLITGALELSEESA